jgi:hypothetical protein
MKFDCLTNDLLVLLFEFLPKEDLLTLSIVSNSFKAVVDNPCYFHQLWSAGFAPGREKLLQCWPSDTNDPLLDVAVLEKQKEKARCVINNFYLLLSSEIYTSQTISLPCLWCPHPANNSVIPIEALVKKHSFINRLACSCSYLYHIPRTRLQNYHDFIAAQSSTIHANRIQYVILLREVQKQFQANKISERRIQFKTMQESLFLEMKADAAIMQPDKTWYLRTSFMFVLVVILTVILTNIGIEQNLSFNPWYYFTPILAFVAFISFLYIFYYMSTIYSYFRRPAKVPIISPYQLRDLTVSFPFMIYISFALLFAATKLSASRTQRNYFISLLPLALSPVVLWLLGFHKLIQEHKIWFHTNDKYQAAGFRGAPQLAPMAQHFPTYLIYLVSLSQPVLSVLLFTYKLDSVDSFSWAIVFAPLYIVTVPLAIYVFVAGFFHPKVLRWGSSWVGQFSIAGPMVWMVAAVCIVAPFFLFFGLFSYNLSHEEGISWTLVFLPVYVWPVSCLCGFKTFLFLMSEG